MNPLPVSTRRLVNRAVEFRDASLANCALLPLFSTRGATGKVVLLSTATRECWAFDWRPELVYIPLFRAARVDVARGVSQGAIEGRSLWYFDPQGVIESGIVSVCGRITARNAAVVLPDSVVRLRWRRDLSRITGVWVKSKKEAKLELVRWNPDWLAGAPPQTPAADAPARPVRQWVLDPIWMR